MNSTSYFRLHLTILLLGWGLALPLYAQKTLQGTITEQDDSGQPQPLVGATIFWENTNTGAITDADGHFEIPFHPSTRRLVIKYVGYETVSLLINETTFYLTHTLKSDAQSLDAVTVSASKSLDAQTIQSEVITKRDLQKAACCNLSESFQNNIAVDVSLTDAVSGTKQIKMLGLDGVYAQLMTENVPAIRGLNAKQGLTFLPGTWIQSIDINKGAGSVANGYESITGQINIELAKPDDSERMLLNLFGNHFGRLEANINTAHKLTNRWSTALLMHGSTQQLRQDMNGNGFLDMPIGTTLTALNRWKYSGKKLIVQAGIQALYDDRQAGQAIFRLGQERRTDLPYGVMQRNERLQGFLKAGWLNPENPTQSIALINNATYHRFAGSWGMNVFEAQEQLAQVQLIYQNNLGYRHELRTGLSYLYNRFDTQYQEIQPNRNRLWLDTREESVPGAFLEHTFKPSERFAAVSGVRIDWHNLYGTFFSPRLHLKYDLSDALIWRASGGRGYRVANPIIENMGYLISARRVDFEGELLPEQAWNYGTSLSYAFNINNQPGLLSIDYYRTDFENQVVADLDSDPQRLRFYNLDGQAFANSLQIAANYEPFKRFDVSLAYKWYDVRSTINGQLRSMPFVPTHRWAMSLGYATNFDKWQFDVNLQYMGTQRLPDWEGQASRSPAFALLNAQVTRRFRRLELYVGGENLGNFMQPNPIIGFDNPFGNNFDAGRIYGPIMGAMAYAGLRFYIK